MKLDAFSPGCGAQISDIDIKHLNADDAHVLRANLARYGVLFFRDQDISEQDHLNFARLMGDIVVNKFFTPLENYPQIAEVRKDEAQTTNIGGGWHTDHSYDAAPALGSILVARVLPPSGGNTRFAHLAHAYDALSSCMKERLSALYAVHSNEHLYGEGGYYHTTDMADKLGGMDRVGQAVHPVVIRHPEDGRPVLYVNPAHTIRFKGMTYEQSRPLLEELYAHVEQPAFTCEFNWTQGAVAFWDNRNTWHFANNDYAGHARLMHRITLAGTSLMAAA